MNRVAAALAARGVAVSPAEIDRQLGGLEGLPPGEAETALLRTYRLGPDGQPLPGFEPDLTPRQVILTLLRESRSSVAYVLVAAIIGLVPAIAVPLIVRLFVDRYLVAGDTASGVTILVEFLACAVTAAVVVILQYAVLQRLTLRWSRTGSLGFAWSSLTMRVPSLQAFGSGDLVARRAAIQRYAFQGGVLLPIALVNSLTAVVYLLMIFILDVPMGIAAIVILAVMLVLVQWALARRRAVQGRFDEDRVRLSGYTAEVVSSAESIKAAAWEQFAFARWAQTRQRMASSLTRLGVASQYVTLIPLLAQTVGLGVFLAIGVIQVFSGRVSLGTVIASQAYMVALLTTAGMLASFGILIQFITSAYRQFSPVLREPMDPEMLTVGSDDGDERRLEGAVSLHEVVFGYGDEPLLQGMSLDVAAGSRVALVGPSGSGKTTVAKLIIGELRPWSGYVALDGVARLAVPRDVRTRDIAYVPQSSTLFPGTIRDNLTLWDPDIDDEALERAARDACIEATILGRPGAFFHRVTSTDGGFSGGELQRLAIARALVRDPRVLVLDEATSALDPVVEADVEANLRRRGITSIVVAHRLSTIRDADEILVIDAGRIVQRGSFDDLVREGLFAELVHG